jgi:GT2 family glycosyltransferase
VITISEFSRRDIVARYGVDPEKVSAIPLGVSPAFSPRPEAEIRQTLARYGLEPGFLFSLGRLNRRKNLATLVRAYAGLRARGLISAPLVIGGKPDYDTDAAPAADLEPGAIRRLGLIADDDLPAFYGGAAAFVFPSLFEGFGLPVLEAMACGCAVVCSDRAAIPALVGEAGLLVDPQSVDALEGALARVLTDDGLRRDLGERGRARSRQFTWRETALRTLDVYREAAGARPRSAASAVPVAGREAFPGNAALPPIRSRVSITIVTWNSARFIERCLQSVERQDHHDVELLVVDNGSRDDTPRILRQSPLPAHVEFNPENRGFAAGQNQAIRRASGDVILVLNPDTILMPSFVREAVAAFGLAPEIGMIAPKLLRSTDDFEIPASWTACIDTAGMYLTPSIRHFDRGAGEPDRGQYERMEHVFGPSAAAAFYSRRLIEDVTIDGQFFDEVFFAYREDADVAWRARLLGWECLYVPRAVAYHRRGARPGERRHLAPEVNLHSIKNRFLIRVKNATSELYPRILVPSLARDLLVIGGVLLVERRSIPGLVLAARALPRALAARGQILARRRPGAVAMSAWLRRKSVPLAEAGIVR